MHNNFVLVLADLVTLCLVIAGSLRFLQNLQTLNKKKNELLAHS